jgi:hypothetical protein
MTNLRPIALATAALLASASASFAQYTISWYTIDGGGGTSSSGALSLSGTIGQHDAGGPLTGGTYSLTGGFWAGASSSFCVEDYNRDGSLNLDDLSDFITDFYFVPAIPGGLQINAPTYNTISLGYGIPCPSAPSAPAPFAPNAYITNGYRVGFSTDGSNSCPADPGQNFPSLDNLAEFITAYYAAFTGGGC